MSEKPIDDDAFRIAFDHFRELVEARSGHSFRSFDEGLAAAWENYKPRLREHALGLLRPGDWLEGDIGSGAILNRTIEAIEIQNGGLNLVNNLVFWQNRYGHANRDHRAILEGVSNPGLGGAIEDLLFGLYRGGADEGATFDGLKDATGSKYPLLAYLFFLKDMERFMPIQPTGFDRAFRALGIEFSTLRQCNWENYTSFNTTLDGLRPLIARSADLDVVRLVDAHSFCWIFSTLLKREAEGTLERAPGGREEGRVLGGRERSVAEMRYSVENTVRNASGQTVGRRVKNKELPMTGAALERHIVGLLELQGERCALTGIRFRFHGAGADDNLLPSVDRIDSDSHYEAGNMQIVCRFVNFWKSDTRDEEFRRLLTLVRGEEESE